MMFQLDSQYYSTKIVRQSNAYISTLGVINYVLNTTFIKLAHANAHVCL